MYILIWLYIFLLILVHVYFSQKWLSVGLNYVKWEQFGGWLLMQEGNGGLHY